MAVLGLGLALSSGAALAAAPASHCAAAETVLFACAIGRKLVSVCAAPGLSATSGWLQYRYGPAVAPQISHPAQDGDWRAQVRGGTLSFSGGGGAFLVIEKAPFTYTVYSAIGQGWGRKAGVLVSNAGTRLAVLRCNQPETSELGPDLFEQAGIAAAEDGSFTLP